MPSASPNRRAHQVKKALVGVMLFMATPLIAWWMYDLYGANPPLVISKTTTYITEPVDKDGLPDYERHLLEESRKGVTPDNNAAVLFWEAMGLGRSEELEVEPGDDMRIANAIGLSLPTECRPLEPLRSEATRRRVAVWLSEKLGEEVAVEDDRVTRTLDLASEQPWRREQIPPLAAWLDDNREALDLLVEAAKRPGWFSPSPSFLNERRELLYSTLLPGAQASRSAVRSLSARANMLIGEQEAAAASAEAQAMTRFGCFQHQGMFFVQSLIGLNNLAMADSVFVGAASKGQGCPTPQSFEPLGVTNQTVRQLDKIERCMLLDSAIGWSLNKPETDDLFDDSRSFRRKMTRARMNINRTLARINYWYDRAVATAEEGLGEEFMLDEINQLQEREALVIAGSFFSSDYRSDRIADVLSLMLFPAADKMSRAYKQAKTRRDLVRLTVLLADQRTNGGDYPDSIDDLESSQTVDVFQGKSFAYRKTDDGYLLYSFGANGADDGGSNAGGDWGATKFEGRSLDQEYWRDTETGAWQRSEDSAEVASLREKIPAGADDIAVRMPPAIQPWPWEVGVAAEQ